MPIGADFQLALQQNRDPPWRVRDPAGNRSDGHSFTRLGAWPSEGAPAMRFVVRSSIVLVAFWFNTAAAQEGYLGHDHDKWHRSYYQMLLRPDTKTPCCNLTDCRPTSGKRVDDHYEVRSTARGY